MPVLDNPRYEIFAQELAKGRSAREAYHLAGYTGMCNISRIKNHPAIQARVAELIRQGAHRAEVTAARTMAEIARVAFADIRGLFNSNGALKPLNQWPDDLARAVIGIDTDELFDGRGRRRARIGMTRTVKLANKLRALEMLGRHLGLFKDKLEVQGSLETMSDDELASLTAELRALRDDLGLAAAPGAGAAEAEGGAGDTDGADAADAAGEA